MTVQLKQQDLTQPCDLRAGAAGILLLSNDSFRLSEAISKVSSHSAPVIVAAARLAGGQNAVPDDLAHSVAPYLDDDDRLAMEASG